MVHLLLEVNLYLVLNPIAIWKNDDYGILSQQKSSMSEIEVSGGAQTSNLIFMLINMNQISIFS